MAYGSIFADADVGPVSGMGNVGASVDYAPTDTGASGSHPLLPHSNNGFAWGFWLGVGGLALLVFIRHNLPA